MAMATTMIAARTEISPDAIGRLRFFDGCARSLSRS